MHQVCHFEHLIHCASDQICADSVAEGIALFNKDDVNEDGFLSFDEFSGPKGEGNKADTFFRGDTDASGHMTFDEAQVLVDPGPM